MIHNVVSTVQVTAWRYQEGGFSWTFPAGFSSGVGSCVLSDRSSRHFPSTRPHRYLAGAPCSIHMKTVSIAVHRTDPSSSTCQSRLQRRPAMTNVGKDIRVIPARFRAASTPALRESPTFCSVEGVSHAAPTAVAPRPPASAPK